MRALLALSALTFLLSASRAQAAPACDEMMVWDPAMGMCMPLPMADMPMSMLMVHGNAFGVYTSEQGPRGRDAVTGPDMFMVDAGRSVGDRHYLNLDYMGTIEKWTFPGNGYPELLQIGENMSNGQPFIDAQHSHSSPVMGLTLSDTIKLDTGEKDNIKVFFAPRGESTDGPIAFMHRPTGTVNPDAPLGHHIGQDVGHISSTVIGASLKHGDWRFEASGFNGKEPQPTAVDLPLGRPDSASFRVMRDISPSFLAMASFAYVHAQEPDGSDAVTQLRYSASIYNDFQLTRDLALSNTLIYGGVTHYDQSSLLNSFGDEFWLRTGRENLWGRVEVLQRTPAELAIDAADSTRGRWVTAATLGFTHDVVNLESLKLGIGGSVTKDFLPGEYLAAYGGNPWTGKVFLQLSGMTMFER